MTQADKDKIISDLQRYVQTFGKIPTYREFDQNANFVSGSYCRRHFTSWTLALKAAGFKPDTNRGLRSSIEKTRVPGFTSLNLENDSSRPKYLTRNYTTGYIPPSRLSGLT